MRSTVKCELLSKCFKYVTRADRARGGQWTITLRLMILLFEIGALIAQFFVSLYDDRAKKLDNEKLHATLKAIHEGINQLVSQGNLARSDARSLLIVAETLQLNENLQLYVRPGTDKK